VRERERERSNEIITLYNYNEEVKEVKTTHIYISGVSST